MCGDGGELRYRRDMLALTLVAVSLGLSNMAAAIGIGIGGVSPRTRLSVGLIFGLFEAGMPILGLLIGHGLASLIGRQANWLAGGLLIATGCYSVITGLRADRASGPRRTQGRSPELLRLLASGLALSIDNLVVGFALGSYQVGILVGVVVIGVVSVALSLVGLEFGARIGRRAGERGQVLGGVILASVGLAVGFGAVG
jgi:putative Mn2+ efflux pump MntP